VIEATDFLKSSFSRGRSLGQYASGALPQRFISDTAKRYLYELDASRQRRLRLDRYEFLVYRSLRNGVEAGDIFCRDSVRFRSIKDDLLDEALWRDHKDKLIADAGLDMLQQPIEAHLAEMEEQLETLLTEVNRHIATGENTHFKLAQ